MSAARAPVAFTRRQALLLGGAAGLSLLAAPVLLSSCAPGSGPLKAQGLELVNPPTKTASGGRITGDLVAKIADVDVGVGHMVRTYTYDGGIPAATWELRPGETIAVNLRNELPALDAHEQAASDDHGQTSAETGSTGAPNDTRPHGWTRTNLHTHGLHVSPSPNEQGQGDNIFHVIEPGDSEQYWITVPEDHTGGLFWYHPHLHGGVMQALRGGMAGAIIIRGAIDEVPEVAAAAEKVLVIQNLELSADYTLSDPRPEDPDGNFWPEDQQIWVVNGQYRPVITMRPGEVQRWRIVNAAADWMAQLELRGTPLHHLAYDGYTLGAPVEEDQTLVVPGGRVEALVKASSHRGEYDLVLLPAFTQPVTMPKPDADGYVQPQRLPRVVATVRVEGEPVEMALPTTLPKYDPPLLPVAKTREITYESLDDAQGDFLAFSTDDEPFNPDSPPYRMKLGTAEEWHVLDMDDPFTHIFHIHVNPFLVTAVNGEPLDPPQWRDTFPLGPADFTFTMNLEDFTGSYVHHCHYVDHEDMGMMEAVEVVA